MRKTAALLNLGTGTLYRLLADDRAVQACRELRGPRPVLADYQERGEWADAEAEADWLADSGMYAGELRRVGLTAAEAERAGALAA